MAKTSEQSQRNLGLKIFAWTKNGTEASQNFGREALRKLLHDARPQIENYQESVLNPYERI